MPAPKNFRTAFNGFHREDVVNHIAYMTTKHEAQVKELREENNALQTELSQLRGQMDQDAADRSRIPSLEQTIADRDAELSALREELETANQLLNEQAAQMAALREELEEAKNAIRQLGLQLEKVHHFPVDGADHAVIILRKVAPTPAQYPRRYAKIKQMPL